MDASIKGDSYMFFYSENGKLKIDYGTYPPSAISGTTRRTPTRTEVLIENLDKVEFSHRTESKVGKGCVLATVTISDPDSGDTMIIKAATLIRNIWPR